MSETVPAIVRSNQPASLKRRRGEDLDSGGSVGQPCCRWKGCTSGRQDNGTWESREFCSKSHRDYFYAELLDSIISGVCHVTEEPSGICKLLGCELPVWETFDFCRAGHAATYRENMTEKWDLGNRLCKLQSCYHHVHVDEKCKKVSEYCCREHWFDAAAARGKQAAAAKRKLEGAAGIDVGMDPVSSDEIRQISQKAPEQLLEGKLESRGYHEEVSRDAMERCLRHLLLNPGDFRDADPSGHFCTVENILDFHPFHEVTEFGGFVPKWYLHLIDSKPGRPRSTKQCFGWKQSSVTHDNKSTCQHLTTTYFHYELKGKSDKKDCDGYVTAYREYEEAKRMKTLKRGASKRWKMSQFSLALDLIMEITGGEIPTKIPVISKIFQDKTGLPVWPPLPLKEETRAMEVPSVEHNASVLVGKIPLAPCHVDETGMTCSVSSNAPPSREGLSPGQEISPIVYSNETDAEMILQDSLAKCRPMEVIADQSNATITLGTNPAVRFQQDRGMTISSEALGDSFPPFNCDDSSPSSEALDLEFLHVNSYFDQNIVGDVLSLFVDGDSWTPADTDTSLSDLLGPAHWSVE